MCIIMRIFTESVYPVNVNAVWTVCRFSERLYAKLWKEKKLTGSVSSVRILILMRQLLPQEFPPAPLSAHPVHT